VSELAPTLAASRGGVARSRVRTPPRLGLGILFAVVLAFAAFSMSRMLPPQPYGLADDWRVFYAAGAVVHAGGNPYDAAAIHPAEQAAQHYKAVQPSLDDFADAPIVGWTLQLASLMPFWASYGLFAALSIIAAAIALYVWLRRSSWRAPTRWTVAALVSWPMLLGVYSGQFDLVLLALTIAAMWLSIRRHPAAAGAVCMAAMVIKPHILWPLPLLVAVAQLPRRGAALQCAGASAATGLAALVGGELLMPGSTSAFVSHLVSFGSRISTSQPDLAGLPGLLQHLPFGAVLAGVVAVLGAGATIAFACFWGLDHRALTLSPERRVAIGVGVGLAIWLVASPYSHPNDDILLFPLIAVLVGANAPGATDHRVFRAFGACAVVVAGFIVSPYVGAAIVVVATAMLWRARREVGPQGVAVAALVAFALLPMVWPFHTVPVSLTPLAVLLVLIAAAAMVRTTLPRGAALPA
jgi:hypothetical protein